MVTGSSAGFVTVWDVKTKKESLTLNNLGRKAVSAVAWDPEKVNGGSYPMSYLQVIYLTMNSLANETHDINSSRVRSSNLGLGSPKLQCP